MTTETASVDDRFTWIPFYEKFADRLRDYEEKHERAEVVNMFRDVIKDAGQQFPLSDQTSGSSGAELTDICPFTVMGSLNRASNKGPYPDPIRIKLAGSFKKALDIDAPLPSDFDGVPTIPAVHSWWFAVETKRKPDDIDTLWDIFRRGIDYADSEGQMHEREFKIAFDKASRVLQVGTLLPTGLYWIRPSFFPTLDKNSKQYLRDILGRPIPKSKQMADEYLSVKDYLDREIQSSESVITSLPDFSGKAWTYSQNVTRTATVVRRSLGQSGTAGAGSEESKAEQNVAHELQEAKEKLEPRAEEAEDWVEKQLLERFSDWTVKRYGHRSEEERTKSVDGDYPGADFALLDNSGQFTMFVEVKSAQGPFPGAVRLTEAELKRAKWCAAKDPSIPYAIWIVRYKEADSTPVLTEIERFEKDAQTLTIEDLVSVGVQVDRSGRVGKS